MRLLAIALALGVVSASVAGCAAPASDDVGDGEQDSTGARYDPDHLLDDSDVWAPSSLTEARIQDFLESEGSYLARYRDAAGRSAAKIILDETRAFGVNPVYVLARIQGESSLIESGRSTGLSHATGCGCPDGAACSREREGFVEQVSCAAGLMAEYRSEMRADGTTRSGWGVGRTKRTLDPCSVRPENMATAALYTYTPWVGSRGAGCGSRNAGGGSLIASIYRKYEGILGH